MTEKSQNLSDEQLKSSQEVMKATAEWLEKASTSDLIFQRSTSRNAGDYSAPISRVNFDGGTTRFRPNTEVELIKSRIASCREAYENSGIITNAIDLMVDFALEGITIIHENKQIQRFYEKWMKKVNIAEVLENMLKSYFIDSNVPILSFRGRISLSEVKKFKRSVGSELSQNQLFFENDIQKKRIIPYKYAVLDILRLHVEGADLLGNLAYEYDLESEDKKRLKDPSAQGSSDLQKIREAVGDQEFASLVKTGRLIINSNRIDILHYKKDGYRRWANPYLWRTIDDLRFKKLLRDMDISVAESVINTFTIVKLGNTVEGYPATPAMFQKFAALLKTNTKSPNLIWNDLVSIEAEYPPVEKILGEAKYDQVNKEIRSSLGIPEVILVGAGTGNFANSFLAVKTLIERLEGARQTILHWLEEQIMVVAEAMDFKKIPFIKMAHIDLEDKTEQTKLMLDMADRGMVSYQTCIESLGESFEIEIQRMKEEDQFRRKNEKKFPYVLIKTGKYGPSISNGPTPLFSLLDSETLDARQTQDAEVMREMQTIELDTLKNPPQTPTEQGGEGDKGGRPAGTKKPQAKKTTPRNKPQGQDGSGKPSGKVVASVQEVSEDLFSLGQNIFDKIYKPLTAAFVKKLNLKDSRSLKDIHKEQIFYMIAHIIPQFGSMKEVTNKNIEFLIRSTKQQSVNSVTLDNSYPKLSEKILNITRNLIRDFKAINGYPPTKNEARDIIASAYAIL